MLEDAAVLASVIPVLRRLIELAPAMRSTSVPVAMTVEVRLPMRTVVAVLPPMETVEAASREAVVPPMRSKAVPLKMVRGVPLLMFTEVVAVRDSVELPTIWTTPPVRVVRLLELPRRKEPVVAFPTMMFPEVLSRVREPVVVVMLVAPVVTDVRLATAILMEAAVLFVPM
jgi:hypothetical protein